MVKILGFSLKKGTKLFRQIIQSAVLSTIVPNYLKD